MLKNTFLQNLLDMLNQGCLFYTACTVIYTMVPTSKELREESVFKFLKIIFFVLGTPCLYICYKEVFSVSPF